MRDPFETMKQENVELRKQLAEALARNVDYCIALTKALGLRGNITSEMEVIADRVIERFRAGEPRCSSSGKEQKE